MIQEKYTKLFSAAAILLSSSCFSDVAKSPAQPTPQQIEVQLDQAEHDFQIAKEMFIPWYTGPLITGSATNVPPGNVNLQPYLYFTVNYAEYNSHGKSVNTPNTYLLNPLLLIEAGITSWLDFTIIPQADFRWQKDHYAGNFDDLPVQFGFQVVKESAYVPNVRFILGEVFPTGQYQHLSSKKGGIDATGAGVYATSVGLNISKILWWFKLHPISLRLATSYNIPDARTSVHGFNAYGGGHHTRGKVKVGNTLNVDLGVEFSLTQKWVFATDVAYTYSNKSTFTGNPGVTDAGTPAKNGAPSSDQLSLAPAIEYNVSDSAGFIGGVWFSVAGRNSADFVSAILSYTVLF